MLWGMSPNIALESSSKDVMSPHLNEAHSALLDLATYERLACRNFDRLLEG